jgi:hypothetical protein
MNLYAITCKTPGDDNETCLHYRGDYSGTALHDSRDFWVELVLAESITEALNALGESAGAIYGSQAVIEIKLLSSFILCQRYDSIAVDPDGWLEGKL